MTILAKFTAAKQHYFRISFTDFQPLRAINVASRLTNRNVVMPPWTARVSWSRVSLKPQRLSNYCVCLPVGLLCKTNTISTKEAKSHLLALVRVYCGFPFRICQYTHFSQQYQRDFSVPNSIVIVKKFLKVMYVCHWEDFRGTGGCFTTVCKDVMYRISRKFEAPFSAR